MNKIMLLRSSSRRIPEEVSPTLILERQIVVDVVRHFRGRARENTPRTEGIKSLKVPIIK